MNSVFQWAKKEEPTRENGFFKMKAIAGDMCLGGEDFDNRITDFCMQQAVLDAKGFCECTSGAVRLREAHAFERVDLQLPARAREEDGLHFHLGRSGEPRRKKNSDHHD